MNPIQFLKKLIYKDAVPNEVDKIYQKLASKLADFQVIKSAVISRELAHQLKNLELERLFQEAEETAPSIESDRQRRYKDYEDIVKDLPLASAALSIYKDNILRPDLNFQSLIKITGPVLDEQLEIQTVLTNIQKIIRTLKIEELLDEVVDDFLFYGDAFIEIEEFETLIQQYKLIDTAQQIELLQSHNTYFEFKFENNELKCIREASRLIKDKNLLETNKEFDTVALDRIKLTRHSPKNVIIVRTFDQVLGYLVIYALGEQQVEYGVQLAYQLLDALFKANNMEKIRKYIDENPEVVNQIVSYLNSHLKKAGNDKIKAKFVPINRMVHFCNKDQRFWPYGASILEPIRKYAKYLIVAMKALMIYRLTRASEKRVFKVDIGVDRDAAKYIEKIKQTITQRKYALDFDGDIDSLVSTVTLFEDLWIPMRQGQEFVQVDIIPGGDLQSKIDDLNNIKNDIISGLNMPPSYLSPEASEESRYTLAQENARFAIKIFRLQRYISNGLKDLIDKVYSLAFGYTPVLSQFNIQLYPPQELMLERMGDIFDSVSRIISTFDNIPSVPKEYLVKKFAPFIDWNEIREYELEEKIKQLEKAQKEGQSNEEETGGLF